MTHTPSDAFLHIARSRLVVHLTGQIRTCLGALSDQQLWWRPNEGSNAVGNLVLHCAGSTRFHIGHVVGGVDFARDRDAEFQERRPLPREELLGQLETAVREADDVLRAFDPARLVENAERALQPATYMQVIAHQLVHYAMHAGQIAFVAKMFAPDSVDDVWRKTPSE